MGTQALFHTQYLGKQTLARLPRRHDIFLLGEVYGITGFQNIFRNIVHEMGRDSPAQ